MDRDTVEDLIPLRDNLLSKLREWRSMFLQLDCTSSALEICASSNLLISMYLSNAQTAFDQHNAQVEKILAPRSHLQITWFKVGFLNSHCRVISSQGHDQLFTVSCLVNSSAQFWCSFHSTLVVTRKTCLELMNHKIHFRKAWMAMIPGPHKCS